MNLTTRNSLSSLFVGWWQNSLGWELQRKVVFTGKIGISKVATNQFNGDPLWQHHYVHIVIKLSIQRKRWLVLDKNSTNFVWNAVIHFLFFFLEHNRYLISLASCNALLNITNLNEHEKKIYCTSCYRRQFGPQANTREKKQTTKTYVPSSPVTRSLQILASMSMDTSASSPRIYPIESETSIGSSPSRSSSEDDSHVSIPSLQKRTYVTGVQLQYVRSRSSATNSAVFKVIPLPSSICPRCSRPVYIAEEVKAAGKVR